METTKLNNAKNGAFIASLKRNNKQIRDDRAMAIVTTAELKYRRKVEDLELKIVEMERELENMLDLSPTNAQSLTLASDFNADDYIGKDLEVAVKIRNERIRLDVAKERFEHLFEEVAETATA